MMFNILTRTNNRPKYFFLCHESIKNQSIGDTVINHYVSVDEEKTMEYLKLYNDIQTIKVEKIPKKHGNEFPYNLYLNTMIQEVNDGWIMVLDDDDKFYRNDSLKILKKFIEENDEDTMLIWRVRVGGRIIPSDINFNNRNIKRADICNIGFMIHSKHKDKLVWKNIRAGDFKVIQDLNQKLNTVWIDEIITATNNNAGNFGNQRDTQLNTEDQERYVSLQDSLNSTIINEREEENIEAVPEFLNEEPVSSPDIIGENNEIIYQKSVVDESVESYDELNQHLYENDKFISNEVHDNAVSNDNELKNILPLCELLKGDEKIYILKESSVVMIAEMLSSAIESKKLYEDILNKKYLHHESSANSLVAKNFEKKPSQQHDAKALLEKMQQEEYIQNKKNLYDISSLKDNSNSHNNSSTANGIHSTVDDIINGIALKSPDNFIDRVYILYKNKSKDFLQNYFESCGIEEGIQCYIKTNQLGFNNIDVINICKKVKDNNEQRVIILHENSLVINDFMTELKFMCNNENCNKYGVIVCGNKPSFGTSNTKVKIQKRAKNPRMKFKQEITNNILFDEKYYNARYDDIQHLNLNNYDKAHAHWKNYGFSEHRYGSRSFLEIKTGKYPFESFSGIILSRNICESISECFDPSFVSIILEKEYSNELCEYSPYLFETEETLKVREYNASFYTKQ